MFFLSIKIEIAKYSFNVLQSIQKKTILDYGLM